jgi:hypothetical protein
MRFIILFLLATLSGCGVANQVSRDICSRENPNILVCPVVDGDAETSTCVVKGVRTLGDNGAILFKGVAHGCSLEEAQKEIDKLPITK